MNKLIETLENKKQILKNEIKSLKKEGFSKDYINDYEVALANVEHTIERLKRN